MSEDVGGRTGLDLLLGGLQVVVGLVILAHTGLATALSLLFVGWLVGWLLFAAGVVVLAAHLFRIGKEGFWSGFLGGGLMTVLGVVFLRPTAAAAVTATLVAGALFLAVGIVLGVQVLTEGVATMVVGREARARSRAAPGRPTRPRPTRPPDPSVTDPTTAWRTACPIDPTS